MKYEFLIIIEVFKNHDSLFKTSPEEGRSRLFDLLQESAKKYPEILGYKDNLNYDFIFESAIQMKKFELRKSAPQNVRPPSLSASEKTLCKFFTLPSIDSIDEALKALMNPQFRQKMAVISQNSDEMALECFQNLKTNIKYDFLVAIEVLRNYEFIFDDLTTRPEAEKMVNSLVHKVKAKYSEYEHKADVSFILDLAEPIKKEIILFQSMSAREPKKTNSTLFSTKPEAASIPESKISLSR